MDRYHSALAEMPPLVRARAAGGLVYLLAWVQIPEGLRARITWVSQWRAQPEPWRWELEGGAQQPPPPGTFFHRHPRRSRHGAPGRFPCSRVWVRSRRSNACLALPALCGRRGDIALANRNQFLVA